jgi:uncharacterized membrane protein (DUF4010 family)
MPVGLLAVSALTVVSNLAKQREGHRGFTSEVAALLTYVVGALCHAAEIWLPMGLGISSAILLSEKTQLEGMVDRLERTEFLAILRFLVVTLLILPLLPNQEYTQFHLNPARVWKIVIAISTLGFVGYFLVKKYGARYGLWLSGVLGGIVSSTAVAVAMGRFAKRSPEQAPRALQATILASSVMYLRLIVLIAIIRWSFLAFLWWKLLALCLLGLLMAIFMSRVQSKEAGESRLTAALINPFEVTPAVVFALLFVTLSVVTVLVRQAFGGTGLAIMAALVGMTDIDPFLLSLFAGSEEPSRFLANAALIAISSNTIVKGFYFGLISGYDRRRTILRFALWALLHLPLLAI